MLSTNHFLKLFLLENLCEPLTNVITKENSLVGPLISLLNALVPSIEAACQRTSPVGCHLRSQASLKDLHLVDKKFIVSDQIMVRYMYICFLNLECKFLPTYA